MKQKFLYGLTLIFVITVMVTIFQFSSRNATASSHTSGRVTIWIAEHVNDVFSLGWDEKTLELRADQITFPVRKCAHFLEYALLAFCLEWHILSVVRLKESFRAHPGTYLWMPGIREKLCWAALAVAGFYACTDEIHQYFVPGRASRLFDVGVDSVGACAGILFFIALYYLGHSRSADIG